MLLMLILMAGITTLFPSGIFGAIVPFVILPPHFSCSIEMLPYKSDLTGTLSFGPTPHIGSRAGTKSPCFRVARYLAMWESGW